LELSVLGSALVEFSSEVVNSVGEMSDLVSIGGIGISQLGDLGIEVVDLDGEIVNFNSRGVKLVGKVVNASVEVSYLVGEDVVSLVELSASSFEVVDGNSEVVTVSSGTVKLSSEVVVSSGEMSNLVFKSNISNFELMSLSLASSQVSISSIQLIGELGIDSLESGVLGGQRLDNGIIMMIRHHCWGHGTNSWSSNKSSSTNESGIASGGYVCKSTSRERYCGRV
jgi:hypothetical protein